MILQGSAKWKTLIYTAAYFRSRDKDMKLIKQDLEAISQVNSIRMHHQLVEIGVDVKDLNDLSYWGL